MASAALGKSSLKGWGEELEERLGCQGFIPLPASTCMHQLCYMMRPTEESQDAKFVP